MGLSSIVAGKSLLGGGGGGGGGGSGGGGELSYNSFAAVNHAMVLLQKI